MQVVYSNHWKKKQKTKKKDITDDMIEYAISSSQPSRDKHWDNVLNAIAIIPPSGRILKVVYKITEQKKFVLTAFWLD